MLNPGSLGKLTGWKAVLAATVIFTFIGFHVWESMPHYHKVDSGTWRIQANGSMAYTFSMSKKGKMAFEFTFGTPGEFRVVVIEEEAFNRFIAESSEETFDQTDAAEYESKFHIDETGSGTIEAENVRLEAGIYMLTITSLDPAETVVKYKMYEYREAS